MNERELKSIKIENILKDELQLVKDKNNKLLKVEASLEIYKSRLAEIPDLKAKLTQALQTNLDYENISGDQMFIKEQNENLQKTMKFYKEELSKVNDAGTKKDIQVARLENDVRDVKRQKGQQDETIKALSKNIEELTAELARSGGAKKGSGEELGSDDMQILLLENKTMKQKLNVMKNKEQAGGLSSNEYNPEFLRVQGELNKKESEVLMLQEKLDLLEATVNEL